jgi:adenylate cyclase
MEHVQLKRRLTAVLLADVVGYSRLMSMDEEGTHTRLSNCVENLIEPTVGAYQGRLTRRKGDGLLAEFDSAVDAVRCAVDIQRRLAEATAERNHKIQLRIGINTGDVIVDAPEVYGNSVNIASRLEGLAEPGGIYVSEAVREQLLGQPRLSLQSLGERRVKNIDRPVRVYRVVGEQEAGLGSAPGAKVLARLFAGRPINFSRRGTITSVVIVTAIAAIGVSGLSIWPARVLFSQEPSIMVLPFRNSSGDPGQDYIADAVTDDLTTDLSRLADTLVIAQATAFTYKGKSVDVREIRREFGIRYMLEGSVGRVGRRVQANAELVDTGSATAIWADRFETDVTSLFELYDAVTGRIAASLHLQLLRAEYRRALAEHPTDPDAVDLRLRAMSDLEHENRERSLAARKNFEKSLDQDKSSAETRSQLALLLVRNYVRGWSDNSKDDLDAAKKYIDEALANNPSNATAATAYLARGELLRVKGDDQGALDAFEEALRFNHDLPLALAQKANQLVFLGRATEAPTEVEKAINMSPNDPALWNFYWVMGRAYFAMRNYDTAINWLQKSVELQPKVWFNRVHLIAAYALTNRLGDSEARSELNEYRTKFKGWGLPAIQFWFAKTQPKPKPAFKANLDELYKGLELAGL